MKSILIKRCKEIQRDAILRTTLKASYNTTLIHSAKIFSEVITSVLKKMNIAPHTAYSNEAQNVMIGVLE